MNGRTKKASEENHIFYILPQGKAVSWTSSLTEANTDHVCEGGGGGGLDSNKCHNVHVSSKGMEQLEFCEFSDY